MKSVAGELVLPVLVLVVGVLAQPRDVGVDDGRREKRLQCRRECAGVDSLPMGVCGDPGRAEFGGRRQLRLHGGEADAELGAAGFIGGVSGEKSDHRLCARVSATGR